MSTPILPFAVWPSGINEASLPANDNSLRNEILNGDVISAAVTAQPGSPSDGDIYILPATHTGAQWSLFDEFDLVIYKGGTWTAYAPVEGIVVNVSGVLRSWDGAAYVTVGGDGGGGSGAGVQFVADTGSTADSDPGAGLLKWNNATQASATVLYIDDDSDDGVSLTGLWPNLDAGGFLYLQSTVDPDTWQLWEVTGVTDATGYAKLAVALRADGGAFADGDAMLVLFQNGAAAGALTNFTEALNSSTPNATVPAASLIPTNGAASIDGVYGAKGPSGSTLAQVPDNASTGGNKRGTRATDWQKQRNSAGQIALGNYSVIGGGRNNQANGSDATVAGGIGCVANGTESSVGGGTDCQATGNQSHVGGGQTNQASAQGSVVSGGRDNYANGLYSFVPGGRLGTCRSVDASSARGISGYSATAGQAQEQTYILAQKTTNATQTPLTSDMAGTASATNQVILPNNFAYVLKGLCVAREAATGDTRSWEFTAHIKRGANAAATAMVAAATVTGVANDAGAAAWALAVDADTTLGCLRIRGTGEAAKTIGWVATVYSCAQVGA